MNAESCFYICFFYLVLTSYLCFVYHHYRKKKQTFLTIWEVTEILCSFKLVLEWETGKEIPESSRLGFLEKFAANNFAFSDAEDNTSWPLNRGGIADLPLLRTQNAKSHESQSFWKKWTLLFY